MHQAEESKHKKKRIQEKETKATWDTFVFLQQGKGSEAIMEQRKKFKAKKEARSQRHHNDYGDLLVWIIQYLVSWDPFLRHRWNNRRVSKNHSIFRFFSVGPLLALRGFSFSWSHERYCMIKKNPKEADEVDNNNFNSSIQRLYKLLLSFHSDISFFPPLNSLTLASSSTQQQHHTFQSKKKKPKAHCRMILLCDPSHPQEHTHILYGKNFLSFPSQHKHHHLFLPQLIFLTLPHSLAWHTTTTHPLGLSSFPWFPTQQHKKAANTWKYPPSHYTSHWLSYSPHAHTHSKEQSFLTILDGDTGEFLYFLYLF